MSIVERVRLTARGARYRWKLNAPEIAWMMRSIPRGGVAVDIGAHKGAYTHWMSRAVGKHGWVVSVEPQPALARALDESMRRCGRVCVRVLNAASERVGRATLHIPIDSSHGASLAAKDPARRVIEAEVELVTLPEIVDRFDLQRLDFVKIDAEGHELEIVRGALPALARFGPAMLIESEARAHSNGRSHLDELVSMLAPLGYEGRFSTGRFWLPVSDMDVNVHQSYGRGRFCNNIAFEIPRSLAAARQTTCKRFDGSLAACGRKLDCE